MTHIDSHRLCVQIKLNFPYVVGIGISKTKYRCTHNWKMKPNHWYCQILFSHWTRFGNLVFVNQVHQNPLSHPADELKCECWCRNPLCCSCAHVQEVERKGIFFTLFFSFVTFNFFMQVEKTNNRVFFVFSGYCFLLVAIHIGTSGCPWKGQIT